MTEDKTSYSCNNCGISLMKGDQPCPSCRETAGFKIVVNLKDTFSFTDTLGGKMVRPGFKRPILEFKERNKVSGKTRNEARESLTIDRIKNRKIHHVEEKTTKGWKVVHDEDVQL